MVVGMLNACGYIEDVMDFDLFSEIAWSVPDYLTLWGYLYSMIYSEIFTLFHNIILHCTDATTCDDDKANMRVVL